MNKFRKLIAPVTFTVALLLSGTANATPMEHSDHGLRHILSQLELTQSQDQDIRQLFKDGRAERQVFAEDKHQFIRHLQTLVQSSDWDEGAVSSLLKSQQQQKSQLDLQRATRKHSLWLLLTAEQQNKLSTLLAQNHPKQRPHIRGLLSKLDLSSEQQAQIAALETQMQQQGEEQAKVRQSFMAAERTLLTKTEFDQDAWQDLHASMQETLLSSAIANAHMRNQIWNLLNHEQQQQVLKLMKEGRKDGRHAMGREI